MNTIKLVCTYCKNEFQLDIKEYKRGGGKFCSRQCCGKYKKGTHKKVELNCECANCGKPFYRNSSKMNLSKSGLHFCCRRCKDISQRLEGIKSIHPNHYGRASGLYNYREKAFSDYPHKCSICGYDKYESILEVHHIDHNRKNNVLSNLIILCPNCHTELTFKERGIL